MPHGDLTWRTLRPPEGYYSSTVRAPHSQPVRTFLPTGYEPNYPYPLLVFFHGQGSCERQVLRLAPRLSRRNYISIGLRAPNLLGERKNGRLGFSWGRDGALDPLVEDYILEAVAQTRRLYHVHSERIYLAGVCEGATLAYRLALTHPTKFAGVISLNGAMPRTEKPLFRPNEMRHLRVLIGHGIANPSTPLALAKADAKLLYSAGVEVTINEYPTTRRLHPQMLRDMNRWVMSSLDTDWE